MTSTSDDTPTRAHFPDQAPVPIHKFLPHMERRTFSKGDVLFKRGDKATEMFYIESGAIRLTEIDKVLGKGELLGEMGVFSPFNERTVSATCEEDLIVHVMDRDGILGLMEDKPRDMFPLIQLAIGRFSENLRQETAAKERMESELRIARDIQISSLPRTFPDRTEFDLFASMDPAKEVGGDFYDFFFVDDDTFFLAVGDVSGKGVPAALFMMTVKTLLKTEALRAIPPDEILRRVNRLICPDNSSFMFVTIVCATLNVKTGDVWFGNAGHNPPLVSSGTGSADYLELPPSPVLGIMEDAVFTSEHLTLGAGGTLFFYTDGVTEAVNAQDEFYSDERLKEALVGLAGESMRQTVGSIRENVRQFVSSTAQFDDITMLALRLKSTTLRGLAHLVVPAELDSLDRINETISACAAKLPGVRERKADLELAVEEVMTNIIFHAYSDCSGTVQIDCMRDDDADAFIVEFTDEGVPFDVLALPDPVLAADIAEREIGGLGVYLVKQLMDSVEYRNDGGRNILTLAIHGVSGDTDTEPG